MISAAWLSSQRPSAGSLRRSGTRIADLARAHPFHEARERTGHPNTRWYSIMSFGSWAKHSNYTPTPIEIPLNCNREGYLSLEWVIREPTSPSILQITIQRGCPEKKAEAFHTGSKASWGDLFLFASFDSSAITFFH